MNRHGSYLVATGIFLSRIAGLVRQRVLSHYLGISGTSDIWNAAFRIPNFLQNLLGEGALSASFIPAYARLLGEERHEEARRLASAVLGLLMTVVAVIILVGVVVSPWLVAVIEPGFTDAQRALTTMIVRILFPATGLLVISAWCLGVLNSHRHFLLSYAAPVAWNFAIIITILLFAADRAPEQFIIVAAIGAVVGGVLQVAVQWPSVRGVAGPVVPGLWRGVHGVPTVMRAFVPNVISRGANQISAFVDLALASLIWGATTAIASAQILYTLPVSLFGIAISAAELPEMARERGDDATIASALRVRLDASTQRLAYYIVPSAMGFLALGGVIAGALFQTGEFTAANSRYVWLVLAGSSIGLLAATLGRLYSSTFYALHDTRTPLKAGLVRVAVGASLGLFAALVLPRALGLPVHWGAAGITAASGIAAWVEFLLLRRSLAARIGHFDLPTIELLKLWLAALAAAATSTAVRLLLPEMPPIFLAAITVPVNALTYLGVTSWWDIPEAAVITSRIGRVLQRLGGRR